MHMKVLGKKCMRIYANKNQRYYLFNNIFYQAPRTLGACAKVSPPLAFSPPDQQLDRENKEAQLQSSHLSSLPRKVFEKYSLGLELRAENQNLLSMAETN